MACDGVRPVFEHVERLADGATDVLSCGAANRRQCQNDGHENGPKRRAPEPSHPYSPKCHVCVPSPCRAGGSLPVGRRAAQSYVVRVLQSHFFCRRASRASLGARSAKEHPSARAARGLWCGLSALRSDDFASFLARLAARALLHSLLETRLSSCVHWAHSRALYCVQRPVGGGGRTDAGRSRFS